MGNCLSNFNANLEVLVTVENLTSILVHYNDSVVKYVELSNKTFGAISNNFGCTKIDMSPEDEVAYLNKNVEEGNIKINLYSSPEKAMFQFFEI